jgi:hypothetical protein
MICAKRRLRGFDQPTAFSLLGVPRRVYLERVPPILAVLGLDPAASAGEVVVAALFGDDARR